MLNVSFGMIREAVMRSSVCVRPVAVAKGSTVQRVSNSRMLGGNTMKKYRIREGSFIDYFRYGAAGFVFFMMIALASSTVYPM